MYYLIGICVSLAAFFAANAVGSLAALAAWRVVRPLARRLPPAARADLIFALRTAPAVLALTCVATLLLPTYFTYEPTHSDEGVGLKLALLALVPAAGFALAAWRAAASVAATRRVRRGLMRRATPLALPGVTVPAYGVEHALPLVAVVGALRPRLFVASHLFDVLGADEISAAVAHELGHVSARDNLKRTLMHACRDVLPLAPFARLLEREWSAQSESAADEFAARAGGAPAAISLASTIVKIARLMPATGVRETSAAIAMLVDGEAGVAERVDRLLAFADAANDADEVAAPPRAAVLRHAATASYLLIFLSTLLLATQHGVTRALYAALEHVVSALS
ncbi:MAG: M48 family metalloprotease [Pyrinomonadaceae bacterium]